MTAVVAIISIVGGTVYHRLCADATISIAAHFDIGARPIDCTFDIQKVEGIRFIDIHRNALKRGTVRSDVAQ